MVTVYFRDWFENIHLFIISNERVGRTILNYLNMINDISPVIIYDEDIKYYYEALENMT
ncbi:hypothetical protein [Thomasclavelia sp.]|uniref:hypothetical protein n=1 Tax=Thomasclavelia sp. TaxID=3025757 RepID=UPI00345C8477